MRPHRTHVGGLLAIALPLAVGWSWPLSPPLAIGLWRTHSFTAWVAGLAGLVVLFPWLGWAALPLIGLLGWLRHRRPPGAILDTARARVLTWLYLLGHLTWLGHGTGSARLACEAAHLRSGGLSMDGGPARNELIQVAYEWGLLGVCLFGLLMGRLVAGVQVRDPISAGVVAGMVLALGTSVLRTRWGLPWWGAALWKMV